MGLMTDGMKKHRANAVARMADGTNGLREPSPDLLRLLRFLVRKEYKGGLPRGWSHADVQEIQTEARHFNLMIADERPVGYDRREYFPLATGLPLGATEYERARMAAATIERLTA